MIPTTRNQQLKLQFIIFLAAALATTLLLASFGSDWGTAYGQTAGRLDLAVTKRVSPLTTTPGGTAVFTMVVTNASPTPHTNVTLSDTVPAQLQIVSASSTKGNAAMSGQQVSVDLGTLAPEETVTLTVTVKVKAGTAEGAITNKVTAQAIDGDRTIVREASTVLSVGANSNNAGTASGGESGGVIPALPRTGTGSVTIDNSAEAWRSLLLIGSVIIMLGALVALLKTGKKKGNQQN
jgi:uncharacterized repeat protein (TIGR01451 family)